MEIKSIKKYDIGKLYCHCCDDVLSLLELKRVELTDGEIFYVCSKCCSVLSKACGIEVEQVEKPDIDECTKCVLRFKCFTNREGEMK